MRPLGMQNVAMDVPALQAAPGITPTLPADMDVDDESFALMDAHETPQEKVDADFFNGASRVPAPTRPRALHTPLHVLASIAVHRLRGRLR